MTGPACHVAIIGAGPYGLATAAYLRSAGIELHVFGETMTFWQSHMPIGMFLRSSWEASHIADPRGTLTLDAYQHARDLQMSTPVPLADFVAYGQWFQQQVVPDLDCRQVERVERADNAFRLALGDGESFQARRVVVAAGIAPFAYRPPQFAALPLSLVSHSSDHADLGCFRGQKVAVIGGGQSALESAVLMCEAGAEVELIMRAPQIRWLRRSAWLHNHLSPIRRLLYPPTDVGPPGLNQIVARPDWFRRFPLRLQQPIAYRSIRPAAAGWLLPRVDGVQLTTNRRVVSASPTGERVSIALDDGSLRRVDHILLATGYRVDIARYPFLASELIQSVRCTKGYPDLSDGFESSVPRLHFLGAPAAWSFGPLMRFVSGTGYAARALTRSVLQQGSVGRRNGGGYASRAR